MHDFFFLFGIFLVSWIFYWRFSDFYNRPFSSLRNEKKIQALGRLICFAKEQSSVISNEDFRIILREVIQTVEDTSVSKMNIDYYY